MERLKVRFSDSTDLKLDDLSDSLGLSKSQIARAAMQIGLKSILSVSAREKVEAYNLIKIEDLKAKQ